MLRQAFSVPSRALGITGRIVSRRAAARPQFIQFASRTTPAIRPSYSRWFSTTGETVPEASAAEEGKAAETEAASSGAPEQPADAESKEEVETPEEKLKKELEAKDAEIRDLKDKYLRSVAEYRTLQDKTARDVKEARAFAIGKFAKDLVTSVDNLDRALSMVPQEMLNVEEKSDHLQQLANLHDGLKLTETILMDTLKKHGLERFEPVGEKYNPNEHEAEFMAPMPDKEDGTVFHVNTKGFKLNGRILRAAKVGVVKNK